MSSSFRQSKDALIRKLRDGMSDLTTCEETIKIIQLFEIDPLMLTNSLPSLIENLIHPYFSTTADNQLAIAQIFYQFAKILRNSRVRVHIPIKIYDLPTVLSLLDSSKDWYSQYMLISWLLMLVISPFNLDSDTNILKILSKFDGMALVQPLISTIKAELWSKNYKLIQLPLEMSKINPMELNNMLKTLKHKSTYPFSEEQLVEYTKYISSLNSFEEETYGLYTLKLLPHLVILLANSDETYSCIFDILFWMTSAINLNFTDLRFKLAESVSKITLFVSQTDPESGRMIVEDCVNDTENLLRNNTNDSMDTDRLHTFLLILAEFCRNGLLTSIQIQQFTSNILPVVSKFQQKRMMSTLGHQIRDAANFFCWSVSRTYTNIEVQPLNDIFLNLLFTANFDHSPLIRKSAMAALQECLGRQGNAILDNVTVIRLVEIHLGQLSNAVILLDLFKEDYPEYSEEMIKWLVIYTVGADYDYLIVKKAAILVSDIASKSNGQQSTDWVMKYTRALRTRGVHDQDVNICSRAVYLYCKIDNKLLPKYPELLPVLHQQNIPKVWSDEISFQALSELNGIRSLISNGSPISKMMADRIFLIIRYTQTNDANYEEISAIINWLTAFISNNDKVFDDLSIEHSFWSTFEQLFRFEQPVVCKAAPFLSQNRFISLFYDTVSKISCEYKAKLIQSLSQAISDYVVDERVIGFLGDVLEFLEDYTTTSKGDVGRLTRLATVCMISQHITLFKDLNRTEFIENSLLRLVGEPAIELRQRSFDLLCAFKSVSLEKIPFGLNAIKFYDLHYRGNRSFWVGYFLSAGAIHSTDKLISTAVDDLLFYYRRSEPHRQFNLLNEFARIVPSSKEFSEMKATRVQIGKLGTIPADITKRTIIFLNFWCRILESDIPMSDTFNYGGFFARVYNLQLAAKSMSITTYSFKLLTFLVGNQILNKRGNYGQFANKFISILLKQLEKAQSKNEFSTVQKLAVESLTQIYMCADNAKNIELLQKIAISPKHISALENAQLFI
ncbi:unnamed protein product [Kluyveromyces dobzhanskii CBS 2104]|uniref:WGS project CCBQ000000000 data, contig 00058 n=1 Tax=Kluyveromyces dobzhanskii CBS 2104 TaxID=1427455 RepID=A0A0A8LBG3_9SACH|nr:unnamed protein product [Kluyveromyces dobzhanskii CBS 2104]